MSLISQTTSYTTPGTYTYTIPQGVGSLEFHLWGAGGAAGSNGPTSNMQTGTNVTQVQTGTVQVLAGTTPVLAGTTQVQVGSSQVQTGSHSVQIGTVQVQTGTTPVQTGTRQVQTGTVQVQTGTSQQAYTVSVAQTNSKGRTTNSKGQPTGGKGEPAVTYTTVTQYRTVPVYTDQPVYTTVPVYTDQPVYEAQPVYADQPDYETQLVYADQPVYVSQPVYTTQAVYTQVDSPIYRTVGGGSGGAGAGGGYSSRKIQVHAGDIITIYVGGGGINAVGGIGQTSGGGSATALNGARGGGGGAATTITVNGNIVAVAAGGGGGGGGGINGLTGAAGSAATISGVGSGSQGSGISSVTGSATGGGGGGGYYSGLAGTSGNSGGGGKGGVCYGTVIQGGNGIIPGGVSLPQYPGHNIGYATHSGAAILIFNKSFNINIKRAGNWDPVNSAWVKVNSQWKEISNGWTKVNGTWNPLISPSAVSGSENLITPAITYSLTADSVSITENESVIFTLVTTGLSAGTVVPYTATGIPLYDLEIGALTGNFIVGTTDSITFTPKLNHVTNGTRTLRVSVDNTTAAAACTITDTSTTPLYSISGNVGSINEGEAVRFTISSANGVTGESIRYDITGISNSRITSGALTGLFVIGSAETVDIAVGNDYTTTGPTIMKITLIGKGNFTTCTVMDTSLTPTYTLIGDKGSINEGGSITFTLLTNNVDSGTVVPYSVTGITSADLSAGTLTGNFIVGTTDAATFTLVNDTLTEGAETLIISLNNILGITSNCTINDTSKTIPPAPIIGIVPVIDPVHGTVSGGATWTVPAGIYSATVTAIGGGGGGGGCDSHAGYNGYAGEIITGTISVSPGQVYTLYSGTGGGGGGSVQGSAPGGTGGTGYASGGNGSAAGPTPYSGGGGGGGGASVLVLGSTPILVAAGGGGGGGGNGSTGQRQLGGYTSGPNGENGAYKGGDGGGAGGGGGGYPLGGSGGTVNGGDSGGNSGNNGQHIMPYGCTVTSANNGGGAAVRNSIAARSGGNGSIIVSW